MQIGNYAFDQDLAMLWLHRIAIAVAILAITWALAKAVHWAFAKLVHAAPFFRRKTSSGPTIGESLGRIVSLLIWLFGALAILQLFDLGGVMAPVQALLNNVMSFVPRVIGAGLIFFIGLFIARIVRDLVVTAIQTVDVEKWANRGGVKAGAGSATISRTVGAIVYILIIIPVAILALDALGLSSVSEPASDMLRLIFDAIPRIIGAAILLGIAYMVSRFVVQILKDVLPGLGVDRAVAEIDMLPPDIKASTVIARVVQIAITLFGAIAATRMLGFPELTQILDRILELGGRVVFGTVVILVGFLIANMLARVVASSGGSSLAATIVRWAGIVLFTFMGLQFMGVGDEIVRVAFSALVIGGAVAGALAFGLGGREAAAKLLESLRQNPPKGTPPPMPSADRLVTPTGAPLSSEPPPPARSPAKPRNPE